IARAADKTIECPATPEFVDPVPTDLCGSVTLAHTDTPIAGNCGTPGGKIKYATKRTWTATDECGNQSSCSQTITVEDNTPPVIACAADKTIECPATPEFVDPVPTDACGNVGLAHTDTPIAGNCASGGKIKYATKRTWTATDECGNQSSCSQTITVEDNTPPVIACAADKTIECPATPEFVDPVPTDLCGSVTLAHTDTPIAGNCASGGKIKYATKRTWTATDECGNQSSCSQTITVEDNTPPVIACAADKTIECPATPEFVDPVPTEACGSVTLAHTDTPIAGNCASGGKIKYATNRTWTATDECCTLSRCTPPIRSEDNTPPVIACAADKTIE